MQEARLWASENRSWEERRRGKISSKTKKYLIEIDGHEPKNVTVNYKSHTVKVRQNGKWIKVGTVPEGEGPQWEDGTVHASDEVRDAVAELVDEMEEL